MKHHASQKRIFAVIVNWNGKKDTDICLSSLQTISDNRQNLHVIVVDNGSIDDSVRFLRSKYPSITVLPTGANLGFTGGNNVGIKHALSKGADIVWLLNNDTIVQNRVLSNISTFDDPSVGACCSKILFAAGHEYHANRYRREDLGSVIWYAGGLVDWQNMYASHRGVDEVDHGQYDRIEETPFITGCSFMVKAEVIRKIGLLDDKFYLYLEDLDWSIRIQRAGWKTMYTPSSVLWHVNAGSSGKPGNPLHEYYFTRNRLLLGFRYAPLRTKVALTREALHFVFGESTIRRKAVFDALFCRFGKQYDPKSLH